MLEVPTLTKMKTMASRLRRNKVATPIIIKYTRIEKIQKKRDDYIDKEMKVI